MIEPGKVGIPALPLMMRSPKKLAFLSSAILQKKEKREVDW